MKALTTMDIRIKAHFLDKINKNFAVTYLRVFLKEFQSPQLK